MYILSDCVVLRGNSTCVVFVVPHTACTCRNVAGKTPDGRNHCSSIFNEICLLDCPFGCVPSLFWPVRVRIHRMTPDHALSSRISLTSNLSPSELYSFLRGCRFGFPDLPVVGPFWPCRSVKGVSSLFAFFRVLFFSRTCLLHWTDVPGRTLCEAVCSRFFTSESFSLWLRLRNFCFVRHFTSTISSLIDLCRDCEWLANPRDRLLPSPKFHLGFVAIFQKSNRFCVSYAILFSTLRN